MRKTLTTLAGLLGIAVAAIAVTVSLPPGGGAIAQQAKTAKAAPIKPVEDDMHRLMEYFFEPAYARLKERLATEPADNDAWKAVRADALVLAEGSNLLVLHDAEDDQKRWNDDAMKVRDAASAAYAAARKKDLAETRKQYAAMIARCNACHEYSAGGEPVLEP
jgi:hypothetical protein